MHKPLAALILVLSITVGAQTVPSGPAPSVTGSASPATAATLFAGADLALGARLIQEHQCVACHVRKVGGDGSAIHKPLGRINSPGYLRGMVEQCNTELNLGLFPDEVTAVAAVINRDHYRFK
jgi:hypothetical protein